jgi:hypothetical protein
VHSLAPGTLDEKPRWGDDRALSVARLAPVELAIDIAPNPTNVERIVPVIDDISNEKLRRKLFDVFARN